MKEKIYTIPINEAFDCYEGCPMCRLYADLEKSSLSYALGGAMMEPDVREQTNRMGFCKKHFADMMGMNSRLSLALMLESHLGAVGALTEKCRSGGREGQKAAASLAETAKSCFVCRRAGEYMEKYERNVLWLWKSEPEFRKKLAKQPYFCLSHFVSLLERARGELNKREYADFARALAELEESCLAGLSADVSKFCKSFDHRFSGMELGEARTAVERAAAFLSAGETP